MSQAVKDIENERKKQEETWGNAHDDQHQDAELLRAAISEALEALDSGSHEIERLVTYFWPNDWFGAKSRTPRELMVRAGALIAAEIDRLDRLEVSDA